MPALNTFKTYPRRGALDKKKYDVGALHGNVVHDDNLFDVYLGESIAPYVTLTPLKAALPVDKPSMTMPLHHSQRPPNTKSKVVRHNAYEIDVAKLDTRMQSRWKTMSALWDANKGKNDKKSLYQRLNYNNILAAQLGWLRNPGDRPVRIAYSAHGEPTAALVCDDKAIFEEKLYQVTCRNLDEAYYLLAIINSNELARAAKPFCTTNWKKEIRDLHKHLWKLPIPTYDPNDTDHIHLSRLGRRATVEAQTIITNLGTPPPTVRKAREVLRHEWQPDSPTAQGIETAVQQLLM